MTIDYGEAIKKAPFKLGETRFTTWCLYCDQRLQQVYKDTTDDYYDSEAVFEWCDVPHGITDCLKHLRNRIETLENDKD